MNITRRDALLGATAAAVVTGAITAPLAMKATGVKAALAGDPVIELAQQLRDARKAWCSADSAFEEAAVDAGFPPFRFDGYVAVETSHGFRTISAAGIRQAADDGEIRPELRDKALAAVERRQHEGQKVLRELGIEPLWQEREHWKAQSRDLRARLLDTPATTARGVLAKAGGSFSDMDIADIRAGGEPDADLPREYAASIYRDLERLAGKARS